VTEISLDLARWWPLVLWPFTLLLAWWSQRNSLPKPPPRVGRALLALRLLLWTALAFLLCGPRLSWNEVQRQPATLAVLLDNSASMRHLDGRLDHGDWLPALRRSMDGVRVRAFAYDGGLRELPEDLSALPGDGVETDVDAALAGVERALTGEHWTGLLVVGDGNVTRGAWPMERAGTLPARIWTAGTGRLNPAADAILRGVEVNRRVRVGQSQPVEVEVESRGLEGRKARLRLLEEGVERLAQEFALGADGGRRCIPLAWTPAKAGNRLLEVEVVVEGGGERTRENNRRALQVKVEDQRLPVLLLAGRPSEDLALLRRMLEAREDLELFFAMPERPGTDVASLNRAVDGAAFLVLAHWPLQGRNRALATRVAAKAARTPMLFLDGAGCDLGLLSPGLARTLGAWQPGAEGDVRLPALDPLLGPEDSLPELRAVYGEMPPLVATRSGVKGGQAQVAGARALLESADGRPLLLVQERAGVRQGWMLAQGMWRWGVGSQLSLGSNHRATEMLDRLGSWLLATPGQGLLEVRTDRESLPAGAPLTFDARLREEDGRLRDGATVELTLRCDSLQQTLALEARSGGAYAGTLASLPPGSWDWLAEARQGDRPVLADSGRVLVEDRSPESLDASRHPRLLQELAALGGGRALDLDQEKDRQGLADASALDSLETRPLLRRVGRQRDLAGEGWVLAALILLMAGEWIWRRLHGML